MPAQVSDLDKSTLSTLTQGIKLPPQPQLMLDIKAAHPDLRKIGRLVSRDPAISAGVLKTVNSPFFGLRRKVASVEQAVVVLGLTNIMNIVNSVALQSSFSSELDLDHLREFWQSTNDVAVACSLLSRKLKIASVDEAFTLGIFHNCAIPIIFEKYPDYLQTLESCYADLDGRLTDIETEHYDADHATVGYFISKAWHLPESIGEAIQDHHNHDRFNNLSASSNKETDELCIILKLAEYLAGEHGSLGNTESNHEWDAIKTPILNYLGIIEDDIEDLSEEVTTAIQEADLLS